MKTDIIWQGNAISCMKSFGRYNCRLCMQERLEIYKASRQDSANSEESIINSATESYGACRHKTKFHRYSLLLNPSADDGPSSPEKSLGEDDSDDGEGSDDSDHDNEFFNHNGLSNSEEQWPPFCMPVTVDV